MMSLGYQNYIEILKWEYIIENNHLLGGGGEAFLVFIAPFSNISVISWRPVLVVEEARVPGENH